MVEGAEGAAAVVDKSVAVAVEQEVVVTAGEEEQAAIVGEELVVVGEEQPEEVDGEALHRALDQALEPSKQNNNGTGKGSGVQSRSTGATSSNTTGEACRGTLVSHGTTKTFRRYGRNPPKRAGMGATQQMCRRHLTSRNSPKHHTKCTPEAEDQRGGGRGPTQRPGPRL